MRKILNFTFLKLALGFTLIGSSLGHAQDDTISYERILSDLNTNVYQGNAHLSDPFASLLLHGGMGFITSYLNIDDSEDLHGAGLLTGVEANLGIDLMSNRWMAEGAVRSFSTEKISSSTEASLREFDLKLVYRNPVNRHFKLRFGAGLVARYLRLKSPKYKGELNQTTPALMVTAGMHSYFTSALSVGVDFSIKNPIITETKDRLAMDASLRLDGHF